MSRTCACGCGETVSAGSRYRIYHHWRAKRLAAGIPDEKSCEHCGSTFRRTDPAIIDQALAHWVNRRFCSVPCRTDAMVGERAGSWKGDEAQAAAGGLRARRMYPSQPCEVCGTMTKVQRHHVDMNTLNNDRSNIQFLCPLHHVAAEVAMGIPPRRHGRVARRKALAA